MQHLSKYTFSELSKLEAQVIEELKKRHFLSVSQAREQIFHIAQSAGIPVEKLLSKNRTKKLGSGSVPVKFRHPQEPTQQWTGRGRQPSWVREWLATGKSMDDAKV